MSPHSQKPLPRLSPWFPGRAVRSNGPMCSSQDPYFMKNHLGSYECKLCLTLHNNEVRAPACPAVQACGFSAAEVTLWPLDLSPRAKGSLRGGLLGLDLFFLGCAG